MSMFRKSHSLSFKLCHLNHAVILIAALFVFSIPIVAAQDVDYGGYRPHYQGFGVDTPGGRGGTICTVTSVSDAAWPPEPGTLRYCVESIPDARIVIFETSGTIPLEQGPLMITSPFLTIAGQTAPSPGILVRGPGLIFDTHDIVIQHIRVRVGSLPNEPHGLWLRDDAHNVVIDHVSVSWAVWNDVSVGSYRYEHSPGDVTIIDSVIAEALACSGTNALVPCDPSTYPHEGYSNSRGMAIGDGWGNHRTPKVAVIRSILANNNDRNPAILGRTDTAIVNNLIYNPSQAPFSGMFYDDGSAQGPLRSIAYGNVLLSGPTTPGNNGYTPLEYRDDGEVYLVRIGYFTHDDSRIYLDGNYYENHCGGGACLASPDAQWMLAYDFKWMWQGVSVRASTPPFEVPNLPLSSALSYADVESFLLAHAGARPLDRDAVDARITSEIATRTGSVPNTPSDKAGPGTGDDGFPLLEETVRPLTVPDNPHEVVDGVGRTQIEAWLEQFARELEG